MWNAYHINAQRVPNDGIAKRFEPSEGKEDGNMLDILREVSNITYSLIVGLTRFPIGNGDYLHLMDRAE
jgi:hypothetical protein